MSTVTTPRTAVLTLASLAERLNDLARRAYELDHRYTEETDRDIATELSLLNGIADSCVFSCFTDYDDEQGLERLREASSRASDAWTYLRSGAPDIQRKLKQPADDEMRFILERYQVRSRSDSSYCKTQVDPASETARHDVLQHLTIPGRPAMKLSTVLFRCTNLTQARRVLRALGLAFSQADAETLRVGDSILYVQKVS